MKTREGDFSSKAPLTGADEGRSPRYELLIDAAGG